MTDVSLHNVERSTADATSTLPMRWIAPDQLASSSGRFWFVIRKRQRLILEFTAITVAIAAIIVLLILRPMYKGVTTVLIERDAPQVLGFANSLFPPDILDVSHDFYRTQEDLLKSDTLAAEVIQKLNLQEKAGFREGYLCAPLDWTVNQTFALLTRLSPARLMPEADAGGAHVDPKVIEKYQARLKIEPGRESQLMSISFTSSDPVLAAIVANAHAQAYIALGLRLRTQPGEEAEEFLREKLDGIKQKLTRSEVALNGYRREHGIVYLDAEHAVRSAGTNDLGTAPENRENPILERLADLSQSLASAEADEIGKQADANLIRDHRYDTLPAVVASPLIQSLESQLVALQGQEASLSSTYTPDHPRLQRAHAQTEQVLAQLRHEIADIVSSTQASYNAAAAKRQQLGHEIAEVKAEAMSLNDLEVGDKVLAREVETNRQLYEGVLQRMKEMGMEAQLRASNVSVIDPAAPPVRVSTPHRALSMLLSVVVGIIGGIGLSFIFEELDNTIGDPREMESTLGVPSLSIVPDFLSLAPMKNVKALTEGSFFAALPTATNSRSPRGTSAIMNESYRNLCTSILLSNPVRSPKTLLFVSSTMGEGKTATVLNTAIAFAQAGKKVLIVDADLRRSNCHKMLKTSNAIGLTEVLTGQNTLGEAVNIVTDAHGPGVLSLLTSGSRPPNPSALLGSNRMAEILENIKSGYDHVLIDSCPLMPMSDSLLLSAMVEGVILVLEAGRTPRNMALDSLKRLDRVRATVLGVVLNRVDMKHGEYGYYFKRHYSSYYQDDTSETSLESIKITA